MKPQPQIEAVPAKNAIVLPATDVSRWSEPRADSIGAYWEAIWRRKPTILSAALLCGIVACLLTIPQTPVYQAQTTLEIQGLNENFLHMNDMTPSAEMYTAEGYIQTQASVLESRFLIRRAAQKTNFVARLKAAQNRGLVAEAHTDAPKAAPLELTEKALNDISKRLKIRPAPPTRIIRITFDCLDPHLAADFVNALAKEYGDQMMEARWAEGQNTINGLSRQLEDLRTRLKDAEDRLQSYTRSAGLMFLSDSKGSVAEDRLKELQDEYSKAQAERIARQSEYDIAVAGKIEALPRVLDSVGLTDTQQKLTALRAQLAEMSHELTPQHYKIQRMQSQIQAMESELAKGRANILSRIRNEKDQAEQREQMLATEYGRQRQLVADQSQKAVQYDLLKHEADTDRHLYDTILERVREAGIASSVQTSNVRVIDPAEAPNKPYKPSLPLNSVLGAMTGLFIGLVYVVTRENYDRRVRRPGEARRVSNTPELGVVPLSRGSQLEQRPVADSMRAMLTSLVLTGTSRSGPRLIVVTSAGPNEGKTTIVRNLGTALGGVAGRVLVVDADLHRPRLDALFGVSNFWGLNNLMHDTFPVDDYPTEALGEARSNGLFILPAGPRCDDSSAVLYSTRLSELFKRLRREYNVILVDTPPLLEIPDARLLGRLSDGVILVIRSGQTTTDAVAECTDLLRADGTLLLGTVLNGWTAKPSSYGYVRRRKAASE